ncbi:porin family protein [Myxococcota bacterium]|nr:porin family protein [Myxococcota bacterium]MBU1412861.1 porin family protein [Myxococcota bacterium]MBU1511367.1 porin family protein [Myxococcota bacterium]
MFNRFVFITVLCAFFATPAFAQDPESTTETATEEVSQPAPTESVSSTTSSTPAATPRAAEEVAPSGDTPLAAGTKSLMFSFGGFANGGLTSGAFLAVSPDDNMNPMNALAQYGIGGRYYLNEKLAVRGAFQFQTTTRDAEGNEDSYTMFGLGGGVQYHFITSGKVSVYAGGMFGFYKGTLAEEGQDDVDITGFGLYGTLGAEYYISRNLSFGAEYVIGFTSTGADVGDFSTDFTDVSIHTYSFYFAFHF